MSNEVYGYIENPERVVDQAFFEKIEKCTGVGIVEIPFSELYNFPREKFPRETSNSVAFIVGDRPGKANASYLIDYVDYAPDANIGFPSGRKERLRLLIELFAAVIHEAKPSRFVVAITECSQIDNAKDLDMQAFHKEIYNDFERCDAPPDCVYDVVIR